MSSLIITLLFLILCLSLRLVWPVSSRNLMPLHSVLVLELNAAMLGFIWVLVKRCEASILATQPSQSLGPRLLERIYSELYVVGDLA